MTADGSRDAAFALMFQDIARMFLLQVEPDLISVHSLTCKAHITNFKIEPVEDYQLRFLNTFLSDAAACSQACVSLTSALASGAL